MSGPAPIRRCKGCGAAAVLSGIATLHTSIDLEGYLVTQRHRCQACGRRFVLCSRPLRAGIFLAGVLLTPILLGLPLVWLGWWLGKQESWNPIVPDAKAPPLRYRNGPPLRTCSACGGACHVRGVTQRLVGVVPAGTDVFYACQACDARFKIESVFGQFFTLIGGILALGSGAIIALDAAGELGPIIGGLALLVLALFVFSWIISDLRLRLDNPVRSDGLLD